MNEAIASFAVRRLFIAFVVIGRGGGEEESLERIALRSLDLREDGRESEGIGTGYCNMSGYRTGCLLCSQ